VTLIRSQNALPLLVAYDIPDRDCGSHSAGGAADADDYRQWIREFAEGIGNRKAVVILEPDALADLPTPDCLSPEQKRTRLDLLSDAVSVLKSQPQIAVYIDAGNARWVRARDVAALLKQAGIAKADGFALNVSNFITTDESLRYGMDVSHLAGNKHFIIDTSRNGQGMAPRDEWCNPDGRGLGPPPTTRTGNSLCDAYAWIKSPGESDGDGPECHDGPPAGRWWPEYALGLCQRSVEQSQTEEPAPGSAKGF
jgi:endoglucanase